jgi:hypothetical protein
MLTEFAWAIVLIRHPGIALLFMLPLTFFGLFGLMCGAAEFINNAVTKILPPRAPAAPLPPVSRRTQKMLVWWPLGVAASLIGGAVAIAIGMHAIGLPISDNGAALLASCAAIGLILIYMAGFLGLAISDR